VSAESNFDDLGIAPDHPGRSPTDTYYINRQTCLRTHTSAHEVEFFKAGKTRWLLTADVYRRDEIDASHYPIFHQMEGASNWSTAPGSTDFEQGGVVQRECEEMEARLEGAQIEIEDNVSLEDAGGWQQGHEADPVKRKAAELALRHLKATLNGLAYDLFGDRHAAEVAAAAAASAPQGSTADASNEGATSEVGEPLRVRWISAFFPFTSPSFEVEVWFRGQWLEILGCGISQQSILDRAAVQDRVGWAFGLGLERIAMVLYSIPDIRLFWSKDERFLKQFQQADQPTKMPKVDSPEAGVSDAGGKVDQRRKKLVTFRPYSKFPSCHKDVSFWLPKPDLAQDTTAASSAEVASPPSFHENDLMELIRETAADLAEDVKLIDSFSHPKTGRVSKCYRINYRSMERSLENEEVNALHDVVVQRVRNDLGVEIR
jgi:phenylalanyl-tRNA synthetase alpha chain